jgi:tripartite ATP-independent transporter DctP family solute receptor
MAPGHPYDLGVQKFKELLEKRTAGQVKVTVFPNAVLGGERDMFEGTKLGTLEMVYCDATISGVVADVRKAYVLLMPFLFSNHDQLSKVLEGPIGDELNELFRQKGVRNTAWMTAGFHQLINRVRPIRTPQDAKNLKMRMWESKSAQLAMQSLGTTVVPMAFPEVYTALQQGVIDGFSNSLATFYTQKYYEVTKYISMGNWLVSMHTFSMGEQFFQKLPPDIQRAVMESGKEAGRYQRSLFVEADKKYLDLLKKETKLQFNDMDREAFKKQVAPVRKDFAELIGGTDAVQFVDRFVAEVDKNK